MPVSHDMATITAKSAMKNPPRTVVRDSEVHRRSNRFVLIRETRACGWWKFMSGFDREFACCPVAHTILCEIGTTDCIHDHCSEKHARKGERGSAGAARAAG